MSRILLITRGSGGDLFPFIRIGQALREHGHGVTLLTHFPYESAVQRAGLDFAALDTQEQFERMILRTPSMRMDTSHEMVLSFRRDVLGHLRFEVGLIRERWEPGQTVLVAHFNSLTAARMAAEQLATPVVWIFTAPAFLSNMAITEELYRETAAEINMARAQIGQRPVYDWCGWWRDAGPSIGLWPEWYAAAEPGWPPQVTLAGFIFQEDPLPGAIPAEVRRALAQQPPVLITHGTSPALDATFFRASLEACERIGRQAIVVTRHRHTLPERLPEGVIWCEYLPFGQVIDQVAAVVHHGGIGTTAQTIAAGVPQLVLPFGFDRPDNGARVKQLGVGDFLAHVSWHPDRIAAALQGLITAPGPRARCAEVARQLRADNPIAAACAAIERQAGSEPSFAPALTQDLLCDGGRPAADQAARALRLTGVVQSLSPEQRALLALRLRKRSETASRN